METKLASSLFLITLLLFNVLVIAFEFSTKGQLIIQIGSSLASNTKETTKTINIAVQGKKDVDVTVIKLRNGTDYVGFSAVYRSIDGIFISVSTPLMPLSEIEKSTQGVLTEYNPVRTTWDGITFITTQSYPLYVRYDHPDNGPYTPPTYNITPDEAKSTILHGNTRKHIHIPKHNVEDIKRYGTLAIGILSILTPILMSLLGLPEPVGSKMGAGIIALIEAIIWAMGFAFNTWVDTIFKTELDDAWMYLALVWMIEVPLFITTIKVYICKLTMGAWRDYPWLFTLAVDNVYEGGIQDPEEPWKYPVYNWDPYFSRSITVWYHYIDSEWYDGVWHPPGIYSQWKCAPTGITIDGGEYPTWPGMATYKNLTKP